MNVYRSEIGAIFFDFVGVLLFPRNNYVTDKTIDAIDEMVGQVVNDNDFRRTVCARFQMDDDRFQGILARIVDKYEPYSPMWDLLPDLRKSLKLGIINNGTKLTFPYFDAKLKITERFDVFISSAIEGLRKPDPEIYLRACQQLGVEPHTCLFMDDSKQNVLGAQRVGMQVIHWKNREDGYQRFIEIVIHSA